MVEEIKGLDIDDSETHTTLLLLKKKVAKLGELCLRKAKIGHDKDKKSRRKMCKFQHVRYQMLSFAPSCVALLEGDCRSSGLTQLLEGVGICQGWFSSVDKRTQAQP